MNDAPSTDTLMHTLRNAGAARVDAVGWHYIETLAARIGTQPDPVRRLLQDKLQRALIGMQARMAAAPSADADSVRKTAAPSPMALLLQEMVPPPTAPSAAPWAATVTRRSTESPRVRQFRQQLRRISVHKQISQAIAQAPQNAGPINSHMLVLRALGLMRDISPDYLNRFMTHLDTLLCLEAAEKVRLQPPKTAKAPKPGP